MRQFLLLFLILSSLTPFAQQNKRQLLKNEAEEREMKTRKDISIYDYGHRRKAHNVFRAGDSEVFLKISKHGYFTVEIDNQAISSPHGKFRFFEINSGKNTLSIYKNGFLIYTTSISIPHNTRMVLDFHREELYILDEYAINTQDDFGFVNPNLHNAMEMTNNEFLEFKKTLESEPFDSNKMEILDMQLATGTLFYANQIKSLLEMFDFDSTKLKMAKKLYNHCADRSNYFILLEAFTFSSSKRELMDFVRNQK